jgi:hypothetical protein
MRWRANFFEDLVGSNGQPSSRLQQSIEISGVENLDRAVERRLNAVMSSSVTYPSGRSMPTGLSCRTRDKGSRIIQPLMKSH